MPAHPHPPSPMRSSVPLVTIGLLVTVAACSGDKTQTNSRPASAPAASMSSSAMSVTILEPQDGAQVQGPSVTVRLAAQGVRIVPAGDTTAGTGHHHLYLDADVGAPDVAVPSVPGHIVHLGTGASEYTFDSVPAGEHRLIAVVANGMHVPLQPWVVDTVRFTVH
jgi:Domain of unknown function (DUF4399)